MTKSEALVRRLPALPPGYGFVRGERGVMAVADGLAPALQSAGFNADATARGESLPAAEESGREPLALLVVDGVEALVRRFTHGGYARALTGRVFRDPARPFRELRISEALRARGVATPRVLAARAVPVVGGFELALVTARMTGVRDVGRLLGDVRSGRRPKGELRRALVDAARLVARLHEVGFVHADLQPANVLVRSAGPRGAIALDLDRSVFATEVGDADEPTPSTEPLVRERRMQNLARLWRHVRRREEESGAVLTPSDLALFLAHYGVPRASLGETLAEIDGAADSRGALHRFGWWLERRFGRSHDARAH